MKPSSIEELAERVGVNWKKVRFSPKSLAQGYQVELEHGKRDSQTNVTNDDPVKTIKIALKHLKETPQYYAKLKQVEND